jgi:hypothetical protein
MHVRVISAANIVASETPSSGADAHARAQAANGRLKALPAVHIRAWVMGNM